MAAVEKEGRGQRGEGKGKRGEGQRGEGQRGEGQRGEGKGQRGEGRGQRGGEEREPNCAKANKVRRASRERQGKGEGRQHGVSLWQLTQCDYRDWACAGAAKEACAADAECS